MLRPQGLGRGGAPCRLERILAEFPVCFLKVKVRPSVVSPFVRHRVNCTLRECGKNILVFERKPQCGPLFGQINGGKNFLFDPKRDGLKVWRFVRFGQAQRKLADMF